jgi:hypothetical protein
MDSFLVAHASPRPAQDFGQRRGTDWRQWILLDAGAWFSLPLLLGSGSNTFARRHSQERRMRLYAEGVRSRNGLPSSWQTVVAQKSAQQSGSRVMATENDLLAP